MSYYKSIFSNNTLSSDNSLWIYGLEAILWNLACESLQIVRIFLKQDFWLFDSSIDTVLTSEFGHDFTILKMAIFHKVDYIEIEPALLTMITQFSTPRGLGYQYWTDQRPLGRKGFTLHVCVLGVNFMRWFWLWHTHLEYFYSLKRTNVARFTTHSLIIINFADFPFIFEEISPISIIFATVS